jgi:hypothetical protein
MTYAQFVEAFFVDAPVGAELVFDPATTVRTPAATSPVYDLCRVEVFNPPPRKLRTSVSWGIRCKHCGTVLTGKDLSALIDAFAAGHAHDAQEVNAP